METLDKAKTNGNLAGLLSVAERFPDEQACRDFLERVRWNGQITCPHCRSSRTHRFTDGRLHFCSACRKQFTVAVGTIFEGSHVPLRKWFMAVYLITSHKKGLSSLQLHRYVGVTQKTAWYMNHRIREAMNHGGVGVPLGNTVEVDETYIGPKVKRLGDPILSNGRGSERKTPVMGAIERNGAAVSLPVQNVRGSVVRQFVHGNVREGSRVITDEYQTYRLLGLHYQHEVVRHSKGEYVRGDVHVNTAESYFSLLKRTLLGTYNAVSRKHLHRYCGEVSYRWSTRRMGDTERFDGMLGRCEGRLTYRTLIS